ncbi:hypothetical protein pb186bvf_000207 [Paramecium bursaria]
MFSNEKDYEQFINLKNFTFQLLNGVLQEVTRSKDNQRKK